MLLMLLKILCSKLQQDVGEEIVVEEIKEEEDQEEETHYDNHFRLMRVEHF